MKLTVIQYGSRKRQIECESFEFRCNHVTSWIMIKNQNEREIIHDVCVIKSQAESEEKE